MQKGCGCTAGWRAEACDLMGVVLTSPKVRQLSHRGRLVARRSQMQSGCGCSPQWKPGRGGPRPSTPASATLPGTRSGRPALPARPPPSGRACTTWCCRLWRPSRGTCALRPGLTPQQPALGACTANMHHCTDMASHEILGPAGCYSPSLLCDQRERGNRTTVVSS